MYSGITRHRDLLLMPYAEYANVIAVNYINTTSDFCLVLVCLLDALAQKGRVPLAKGLNLVANLGKFKSNRQLTCWRRLLI